MKPCFEGYAESGKTAYGRRKKSSEIVFVEQLSEKIKRAL